MRPLFSGENVDPETGRWVLGKDTAQPCPYCGHEPVVKFAGNGKAELWHTPVTCCHRAIARTKRWGASQKPLLEESQ